MRVLLFLSLFLISDISFSSTDCGELYRIADRDCNSNVVECRNLGACLIKRRTCPRGIRSESDCMAFNNCMGDVDKLVEKGREKGLSRFKFKNPCLYRWSNKNCRLHNTRAEIINFPTCPGRRIAGEGNDDRNFDCEGHRQLAKTRNETCRASFLHYNISCRGQEGYREITKSQSCQFLETQLFPADIQHMGEASTIHGSRNKEEGDISPDVPVRGDEEKTSNQGI